MPNEKVKNCWDYWDCEVRKDCPAYKTDSGDECWFLAGTYSGHMNCPKVANKFEACWDCPWFKKFNKDF